MIAVTLIVLLLTTGTSAEFYENSEDQSLRSDESYPNGIGQFSKIEKRYPLHLDPVVIGMGPKFWITSGECPKTTDGGREYFCPSPTQHGTWVCVDDYQLCDGIKNCPHAEDESAIHCLFFRILRYQIALLTKGMDAIDNTGRTKVL